ncbi:glycosyltransferase [Paucilactobacillus kaifaensis]|uniref:glycosyltransferase n=1 Tax=Paucilactobacillus kaifaensis TaxID=2559921 RepID=UPI0010F5E160|nr:glycosyltransferase [Paucilactobacillus kaifaensis]
MYYFVNQYLLSQNSSVEHAEIKRVKLFDQHQVPAKIVTRDFDLVLHRTIEKFGLTDDNIINMYDFFAQTTDYEGHIFKIDNLKLPIEYQVGTGNNFREVTDGSRLVCEVHFAAGTVAQINHIDYFDEAGNLNLRSRYDIRGFKAADEFFGQDGNMFYQVMYRPDGNRYLESYYVKSTENTPINSLNHLMDYRGRDYYFNSLDDLFAFFLEELANQDKGEVTFIADRPAMANLPVLNIKANAHKYLWLPINHAQDGNNPVKGMLNNLYQFPFTKGKQLDGVIVMTQAQKNDLTKRTETKQLSIHTVSGAIADEIKQKVAINERTQHQLIYVGRLGIDKQIDQLLQVFKLIHEKINDATLAIYGYGATNEVDQFKQQVIDLKLDEPGLITFAGYQLNLEKVYDNAQLLLDTSSVDGQPLAMVEAISHGVPVLSYDYNYGPREIIVDGKNGYLLPRNNITNMAKKAISLLNDEKQLQEFSSNAYQLSERYSADNVWQQWQALK